MLTTLLLLSPPCPVSGTCSQDDSHRRRAPADTWCQLCARARFEITADEPRSFGNSATGYGTQSAGGYSTDRLTSYHPVDGQYTPTKEVYPPGSTPPLGSGRKPAKSSKKKWLWIGIPLLLLVIAGAVVGGVVGSRSTTASTSSKAASNAGASSSGATGGGGAGTATGNPTNQAFALPTLDQYGNPEYVRLSGFRISR